MQDIKPQQELIIINTLDKTKLSNDYQSPQYQILLIDSETKALVDFTEYYIPKQSILFLAPYQHLQLLSNTETLYRQLTFYGDYYCIEYHKKEVACNGILFNNIYIQPFVETRRPLFDEIERIYNKIKDEIFQSPNNSDSIIKAYLQLLLALCSKEKKMIMDDFNLVTIKDNTVGILFQRQLEQLFRTHKSVQYYAEQMDMSIDSFSKKIKQQLGKSPSILIQDRIVLEAKRLLHLTYSSVKQIAEELNFNDEHYFSRYFKKNVGVSPSQYRDKVGISIVAK